MNKPTEVSYENYEEMLGILPPERHIFGTAFLVGEPSDHEGPENAPRYAMYSTGKEEKYYFHGPKTVAQFNEMVAEAKADPKSKFIYHPAQEFKDQVNEIIAQKESEEPKLPIETLKEMIENHIERHWVANPAKEGQMLDIIEQISGAHFSMTTQNAMEIVIESIEQSALYEKPVE